MKRLLPLLLLAGCPDVPPSPPADATITLTATEVHAGSIALAWTDDPAFVRYELRRGDSPSFADRTTELIATTEAPRWVDTGGADDLPLAPLTTYYYQVRGYGPDDEVVESTVLEVRTLEWDADALALLELREQNEFASAGDIGGVAWDGTSLWIAYRAQVGGTYDPDTVTLVRRDLATGVETPVFFIADLYAEPRGLVWDGEALWIATSGTGQSVIRRYAPDGRLLTSFAAPEETTGLAWDGSHLLVATTWNEVEVLDPASGGAVVDAYATPFEYGTQRGIASHGDELWSISWTNDDLAILDKDGAHIAVARVLSGADDWTADSGLFLTFAGDRLVVAANDRVYLLAPVAVEVW